MIPDSPIILANGKLVCHDHGLVVCHKCCVDYSFVDSGTDDSSNSSSLSSDTEETLSSQSCEPSDTLEREPPAQVLTGAAAKSWMKTQGVHVQLCGECGVSWAGASNDDDERVLEYHPFHDTRVANLAERRDLVVHIDGACPGNGSVNAIAGIGVFFGPNSPYNISSPCNTSSPATNQKAEISTAIQALSTIANDFIPARRQELKELGVKDCPCHAACWAQSFGFRVILVTDSSYVVECMTKHVLQWEWHQPTMKYLNRKSGKVIANSGLIRRVVEFVEKLASVGVQVLYRHVERKYNVQADQLAQLGARKVV